MGLLLVIAGIGLATGLVAVSGDHVGPATGVERILSLGGGVACVLLGFFWWYFGAITYLCETSCPPESLQNAEWTTARILAVVLLGPPTVKLLATGLTGELRFARRTWIFVAVAVVVFVAWFIGWGIAFHAARPGSP